MDAKPFKERLEAIGWSTYKLAQELDKSRKTNKGAGNYTSTVAKFLASPDNSRTKTFEEVVNLMGGEIIIRWKVKEEVTVGHQEVKI